MYVVLYKRYVECTLWFFNQFVKRVFSLRGVGPKLKFGYMAAFRNKVCCRMSKSGTNCFIGTEEQERHTLLQFSCKYGYSSLSVNISSCSENHAITATVIIFTEQANWAPNNTITCAYRNVKHIFVIRSSSHLLFNKNIN